MISNKNRTTLLFAICLFPLLAVSQSAHKSLRKGDAQYKDGRFTDAETAYRKADGEKSSVKSAYNRCSIVAIKFWKIEENICSFYRL